MFLLAIRVTDNEPRQSAVVARCETTGNAHNVSPWRHAHIVRPDRLWD